MRASVTASDRLALTVFFAVMLHGIFVLGVAFVPEDKPQQRFETMQIVLVEQETLPPKEAELIAQKSSEGDGRPDEETTSLPAPELLPRDSVSGAGPPVAPQPPVQPQPEPEVATEQPEPEVATEQPEPEVATEQPELEVATEQPVPELVTEQPEPEVAMEQAAPETVTEQPEPDELTEQPVKPPVPETPAMPEVPGAMSLMANRAEMASLSARIARKLEKKAKRPRKKFISASTKENKYALYMKLWSARVERIGNLNYPEEARKGGLSGSLRMEVALNNDGSIYKVNITKSSGSKILDDAALRIVELAAPYPALPDDIRAETDILHIIRTWRFSDQHNFK